MNTLENYIKINNDIDSIEKIIQHNKVFCDYNHKFSTQLETHQSFEILFFSFFQSISAVLFFLAFLTGENVIFLQASGIIISLATFISLCANNYKNIRNYSNVFCGTSLIVLILSFFDILPIVSVFFSIVITLLCLYTLTSFKNIKLFYAFILSSFKHRCFYHLDDPIFGCLKTKYFEGLASKNICFPNDVSKPDLQDFSQCRNVEEMEEIYHENDSNVRQFSKNIDKIKQDKSSEMQKMMGEIVTCNSSMKEAAALYRGNMRTNQGMIALMNLYLEEKEQLERIDLIDKKIAKRNKSIVVS